MDSGTITLFEVFIWPAFLLTLAVAILEAWRRRTRENGLVAVAISLPALGWLAYAAAIVAGRLGDLIHVILLLPLLHPFILFILARTFRPLPRYSRRIAGLLFSIVAAYLIVGGPAISTLDRIVIFGYLIGAELLVTFLFLVSSRHHGGITRRRLQVIGLANVATIIAMALAGLTIGRPPQIVAQLTALFTLLSMFGHLIGFSPPRRLRRLWQRIELERFLRDSISAPPHENVNAVLDRLEQSVHDAVAPRAIAILQWERETERLRVVRPEPAGPRPLIDPHSGALSAPWTDRRPTVTRLPAALGPVLDHLAQQTRAETALIVPIATEQELWGLLIAFTGYQPLFATDELPQIHLLASQCALLISYGETLAMEQAIRRRAEALADVARVLTEQPGPGDSQVAPFSVFCDETAQALDVPIVVVRVLDVETQQLNVAYARGLPRDLESYLLAHPLPQVFADELAVTHPVIVRSTLQEVPNEELRERYAAAGVSAMAAAAMVHKGQHVGNLSIATTGEPHVFSSDDLALLRALAAQGAGALANTLLLERLQRHTTELESKVAQRTADLQRRNEDLDAFAHTVAHDLKDPVSNIIGFSEILLLDSKGFETDQREYLEIIQRNGRTMEQIINELLLLANVRQADLPLEVVDMQLVVLESLARLEPQRDHSRAEVILPDMWPAVIGYGPWLEEVWVNYLTNAIKYGGEPPRLHISTAVVDDGFVRYAVRDNGPGIPPERLGLIFTASQQTRRHNSHGFGLSIVRQIVEKLSGRVGVASELDTGSTFWFELPAASAGKPAS